MTPKEYANRALEIRQQWLNEEMSHKEYVNIANVHVVEMAKMLLSNAEPKRISVSCCAECPLTEGEDATYLTPGWKHCIPADRRLPQPIPRNERPSWCPLPILVTADR